MKQSKLMLLLTVLLIFMSLPGYPHDRGNGRPRMPAPAREQHEQDQTQQPQQQQAQVSQQVFDEEYFFDEIWDGMKAENHIQLAVAGVKAVLNGFTSEGLMNEFLAQFDETRKDEIVSRVEEKKLVLREKYQTLPLNEEAMDIVLTGAGILKVIEDLNKTH